MPAGCAGVDVLEIGVAGVLAASEIRDLTGVTTLDLRFDDPPGALVDAPDLLRLRQLEQVSIRHGYDVAPEVEWLDANMHDPLRYWTAFSWEGGRSACIAYDRVRAAVAAAEDRAGVEIALRAFIEELNRMPDSSDVIHTDEREFVLDLVRGLGAAAGLDDDVVRDMFDRRDF